MLGGTEQVVLAIAREARSEPARDSDFRQRIAVVDGGARAAAEATEGVG